MELASFQYSEFENQPRYWRLNALQFEHIKLIVAKNATGKTRALNVIAGLAGILSGQVQRTYVSGNYRATFQNQGAQCVYELNYDKNEITHEKYSINSEIVLRRSRTGRTILKAEKLSPKRIELKVPKDQVAAFARRDERQHPYLNELFEWASGVRHYELTKGLGRTNLILPQSSASHESRLNQTVPKPNETTLLFKVGSSMFGAKFKRAILRDMSDFGYDCSSIGTRALEKSEFIGPPVSPEYLYVREKGLKIATKQHEMSDGMFGALALSINLNYLTLTRRPSCILIDDIGENLDFDRSTRVIKHLIEKATGSPLQLIMTTNNRFVMNGAPLECWSILDRNGNEVSEYNRHNSKKLFSEFKYTGLNNFDFFASAAYKPKKRN